MSRYPNIDCPVCHKPLENGEEVVVCPECGAPYHRHCYLETGHCLYPELHRRGESWRPPRAASETWDGNAQLRCSRCGTINPAYGIFCQVCGNKLNDKPMPDPAAARQPGYPPGAPQSPFGRPGFGAGMPFPPEMPLNPFTTPFGGVAPDEEIDGVSAKDLAVFVGRNSHYFLPRFKDIVSRRAKSVNWSAFLFHGGYFLYRKMWLPAILTIAFYILLNVPSVLMLLGAFSAVGAPAGTAVPPNLASLSAAYYVCQFLIIALHFLSGFFANSLYERHCRKKILAEKEFPRPEEEYLAVLSKKGGVAQKLVTVLLIVLVVLYMAGAYAMIFRGGIGGF